MIPQSLGVDLTVRQEQTRTYGIDFENNRITGAIDGIKALEQAVTIALNTARFEHDIYDFNHGTDRSQLIGLQRDLVVPEVKRIITESLLTDSRITGVTNFRVTINFDSVHVRADVIAQQGIIPLEVSFDGI